jgi:hypothetical protein
MKTKNTISAIHLGKQLAKQFIRECLLKGMNDSEIQSAFTIEELNRRSADFCEKYNYKLS